MEQRTGNKSRNENKKAKTAHDKTWTGNMKWNKNGNRAENRAQNGNKLAMLTGRLEG